MNETSQAILTIISIFTNIVLTSVIIYLTNKTTKANEKTAEAAKDSAESSELSFQLSKQAYDDQINVQRKRQEALTSRYTYVVKTNAIMCKIAFEESFSRDYLKAEFKKIRYIPRQHELSYEVLAEYFSKEEADQIQLTWYVINEFMDHNEYDKMPSNGETYLRLKSNASNSISALSNLISMLEKKLRA